MSRPWEVATGAALTVWLWSIVFISVPTDGPWSVGWWLVWTIFCKVVLGASITRLIYREYLR